jgi:hypothetical protein
MTQLRLLDQEADPDSAQAQFILKATLSEGRLSGNGAMGQLR